MTKIFRVKGVTELKRARAHLREKQEDLAHARAEIDHIWRAGILRDAENNLKWFESEVLAALSWVWDAQERQHREFTERWREATKLFSVITPEETRRFFSLPRDNFDFAVLTAYDAQR